MQRFYGEKRDIYGRVEPGATVTVYTSGTSTLATIYSATDPLDTPTLSVANPFTTDANGRFSFAAPDGEYDCIVQGTGSNLTLGRINFVTPKILTPKTIFNNGSTTTYTMPTSAGYVYLTTSAASLTVTYPVAAPGLDGTELTLATSAGVGTATFVSSGATFVGAPASFTANVPVRFKFDYPTLKWYPF